MLQGMVRQQQKKQTVIFHRIAFFACSATVLCIGAILALDVFSVGARLFLFSMKLLFIPVLFLAVAYIAWHAGRFLGHRK